jgi:hypothetical protein
MQAAVHHASPLHAPWPATRQPTCHRVGAEHRAHRAVHLVVQREGVPAEVALQRLAGQAHIHATQDVGILAGGGGGAQRGIQVALRAQP